VVVVLAGTAPALAGNPFGSDPVTLSIYQPTPQVEGAMGLEGDECGVALDECGDLCYCGPCWTVGAGMVIKKRNRCFKKNLVVGAGPDSHMDTNDLDLGWGVGPWIEIIRHLNNGLDLEVEYFSIDNFNGSAIAHDGSPAMEWSEYWGQFTFGTLQAWYSNELYSLEFNLKWPLCESDRWKGIAGLHWIELKEEFVVAVADPPPPFPPGATGRGMLTLDNHLYGFHLGAEGILWQPCPRLWVEGLCKAGIYGNHANRVLRVEGAVPEPRRVAADDSHLAFASEIALMAVWKPCCNTKVFLGYEGFHLKEVANVKTQDKCQELVIFDDAFFYGFLVGVEVSLGKRSCCPTPCEESCATCE
jgi:hypothetical protein